METAKTLPRPEPSSFLGRARQQVGLRRAECAVGATLLASSAIVARQGPSFLPVFLVPVLFAGLYRGSRQGLLAGALSIAGAAAAGWLTAPAQAGPRTLLYFGAWALLLLAAGLLSGWAGDQARERIARLKGDIAEWKLAQEGLLRRVEALDRQNATLDTIRKKLETALYSTMDPWVAHMLVHKRLTNEKREISVLFADIVNFTAAVEEMAPEDVVRHTNRLFMEMEPIIMAFNGHVDKFIGDGLMAEFGMPLQHQQNALQSVLAALQIQKRVSSPDFRWKLRIGIAHGEALVGLVGSERRKSYTALGDVVNVAARLQKVSPEGGVCVDGATYDQMERWFNTRRLVGPEPEALHAAQHEALARIQQRLGTREDCDTLMEAAKVCGDVGEVSQAVEYYRKALSLNPQLLERVEASITELVLTKQTRPETVRLKGKHKLVRFYEVVSLKDPLTDLRRIPASVRAFGQERLRSTGINRDALLPIEALDGTLGHSVVTASLAGFLAASLGMDDGEQRQVFEAGFYHDVGKRNVPEHILNQDVLAALPEADQQMIRVHVEATALVLSDMGIKPSGEVLSMIEAHHEKFDGTGYPRRMSRESIPAGARIIRIADEYDRLTSFKGHREGLAPTAALAELRMGADNGTLDAKMVAAFTTMIKSSLAQGA